MLKNRRKTKNIKKKRKTDNTVWGFRLCFALRNLGSVPEAIKIGVIIDRWRSCKQDEHDENSFIRMMESIVFT